MMSFFRWLRDIWTRDDFVNDPAPYDAMVLEPCVDESIFVNDPTPYDAMVLEPYVDESIFVNDPTPYDAQIFEGEPGYVPPVREELFPEDDDGEFGLSAGRGSCKPFAAPNPYTYYLGVLDEQIMQDIKDRE